MAYVYSQTAQPVCHPLDQSQRHPALSHSPTDWSAPQHYPAQSGPPYAPPPFYTSQPQSYAAPTPSTVYHDAYYTNTSYSAVDSQPHPAAFAHYNQTDRPPLPDTPRSNPHHASLTSRPLPRPLPQAPHSRSAPANTPPPPVPDASSRPPARYAPALSRSPVHPPAAGTTPSQPDTSSSRPLPPCPNAHARPLPSPAVTTAPAPTRQPRRHSSTKKEQQPQSPPSISIEPEDQPKATPTVPSFSFSGPEADDEEVPPKPAAAAAASFSVTVAPPSPPKMKAVTTTTTTGPSPTNELGQSQSSSSSSKSDLSDSITTLSLSQEMVCAGCSLPIGGRIVSAMKRRWHPECFKCAACSDCLEHVAFYEAQGQPFCHVDYHEKFSIRCYHCQTPIESETYVTLDDPTLGHRYYHELHFFCSECGDPFIDPKSLNRRQDQDGSGGRDANDTAAAAAVLAKPFVVQAGWPYCEACNVRLHKPKCAGCKTPIQDEEVLGALGKQWHEDCFVCHRCREPFEDSFLLREGDPYCESCYKIALRSDV